MEGREEHDSFLTFNWFSYCKTTFYTLLRQQWVKLVVLVFFELSLVSTTFAMILVIRAMLQFKW